MNAFHAYDIRGIYNRDFNKEDVYKIGFFLPELLKTNQILVGRDVRTSSPEIFTALCRGINDTGADVLDLGICTTPMVYYITAKYALEASVMITASHNPKAYNGMKISRAGAVPVGYDSGLKELEEKVTNAPISVKEKKGKVLPFEKSNEYLDFLKTYVCDFSDLNIVVDCSNGMAGLFAEQLFGEKTNYLYKDLDGTFPNHEANPLNLKNIVDLQAEVKKNKADLGVIFDGDADRVMFVDENGKFIPPDLMIALLADYFEPKQGKFLQDIRTSKAVAEYVGNRFESHMWRVGRAYAALKLREIDGIFGGEYAGHYYFKDFYYSDSGLLAALIFLTVFTKKKKQGKTVSQVIGAIAGYYSSGEINFKINKKMEAMEAVKNAFMQQVEPKAYYDFDGYRLEFEDWWFNIRPSNTEPYLRLLIEAKTQDLLDNKQQEISRIINQFD